jgi:hypothetical protein
MLTGRLVSSALVTHPSHSPLLHNFVSEQRETKATFNFVLHSVLQIYIEESNVVSGTPCARRSNEKKAALIPFGRREKTMNATTVTEEDSVGAVATAQLPAVLMAISSVLVDAAFRRELFRDRIWTQLILWLAASLQQTSTSSELWIHGVFACSVLSATYVVLALRWALFWSLPDYTRLLAPSVLVVLLHDILKISSAEGRSSWVVFLLAFASLAGWKWYSNQRHQRRRGLIGMPVVVSQVNLAEASLDESHWIKWTRSQALKWIASLDDDWRASVCSLLAPEGITGSVLRDMTTGDLRSMGVSYGDSRRLVDHIQLLVSKYPDRNYRHQVDSGLDMVDEWLGDDSRQKRSIYTSDPHNAQPATSYMAEMEGFDQDALETAKKMMREKFGFELPELRIPDGAGGEQQSDAGLSASEARWKEANRPLEDPSTSEELPVVPGLPSHLLAGMPEHIREIAMRKPELITELLNTHHNESKERTPRDPELIRRMIHESVPPRIVPTEATMPNDYDNDEETTTLLRKRAGNPKYSSMR